MTDEERKQLCEALRGKRSWSGALAKLMPDAADEIERLAEKLQAERKFNTNANEALIASADEIERLYADKLNAEYQRDQALAQLKDQDLRLERLAKRVEQLEASVEALQRM